MNSILSNSLISLTLCAIQLINGYPLVPVLMNDEGAAVLIPVESLPIFEDSQNDEPQQQFYIIPYSVLKQASDEEEAQADESNRKYSKKQQGQMDAESDDEDLDSDQGTDKNKSHVIEHVDGYKLDLLENVQRFQY